MGTTCFSRLKSIERLITLLYARRVGGYYSNEQFARVGYFPLEDPQRISSQRVRSGTFQDFQMARQDTSRRVSAYIRSLHT